MKFGRGDWIRTSDPLLPKQMRYQAALRPEHGQITWTAEQRQLCLQIVSIQVGTDDVPKVTAGAPAATVLTLSARRAQHVVPCSHERRHVIRLEVTDLSTSGPNRIRRTER